MESLKTFEGGFGETDGPRGLCLMAAMIGASIIEEDVETVAAAGCVRETKLSPFGRLHLGSVT